MDEREIVDGGNKDDVADEVEASMHAVVVVVRGGGMWKEQEVKVHC